MKRFIILATIGLFVSSVVNSQVFTMVNPNGLVIDTASQVAAEGPTVTVKGPASQLGVTMVLTKVSGTVAGKVYLKGANYAGDFGAAPLDSVILRDESVVIRLKEVNPAYMYYKVDIVLSGTSSVSYTRPILYARKN